MKKLFLFYSALFLAACSSTVPNLVHTQKPILNISAKLAPFIDADVSADSAWIKNRSDKPIQVAYSQFWYDKNGVTQLYADNQEFIRKAVQLMPNQKTAVALEKPSAESQNYRLYLQLNH